MSESAPVSQRDPTPNHYVHAILPSLAAAGHDVHEILLELGIEPEHLAATGGVIPAEQFVALVQRSWALLDDEFFGLSGTRCKPGLFALMARYICQFDTLQAGLNECVRFYGTLREDLIISVETDDEWVYWRIDLADPSRDKDHFLQEFIMVSMHRLLCWLTDTKIFLQGVSFAYPEPGHVAAYERLFHCELSFEQPATVLSFPKKYLSRPLIRRGEELKVFLETAPADLMLVPGTDDSFATRIKGFVLGQQRAGGGVPDFAAVASKLCVSQQTLRRKLQAENTSYQQIKDVLRRDIAIDKLINENLSVAEVAELLGFVEPASFTRAFKHWTGVSPAVYRQQATGV